MCYFRVQVSAFKPGLQETNVSACSSEEKAAAEMPEHGGRVS